MEGGKSYLRSVLSYGEFGLEELKATTVIESYSLAAEKRYLESKTRPQLEREMSLKPKEAVTPFQNDVHQIEYDLSDL